MKEKLRDIKDKPRSSKIYHEGVQRGKNGTTGNIFKINDRTSIY